MSPEPAKAEEATNIDASKDIEDLDTAMLFLLVPDRRHAPLKREKAGNPTFSSL